MLQRTAGKNVFQCTKTVYSVIGDSIRCISSSKTMVEDEHDAKSDHQHGVKAAEENSSFFANGVASAATAVKEKVSSAVGMNDNKPISEGETMGPAGHMQGRNPDANPEDEYASLKAKSSSKWDDAGQDKPPNQQYPDHGKNS